MPLYFSLAVLHFRINLNENIVECPFYYNLGTYLNFYLTELLVARIRFHLNNFLLLVSFQ